MGGGFKSWSEREVGRLSLYRRLLAEALPPGQTHIFSHELARLAHVTPAQVRRDLMPVGSSGHPVRGYEVGGLLAALGRTLDPPEDVPVALVGAGNLGRAVLAFFQGRRDRLRIVAAFDRDPAKVGRVLSGVPCRSPADLPAVAAAEGIRLAILCVPRAEAQGAADRLVAAGVKGILNFAPAPLRAAAGVYIESLDMTTSLEKVAFFALGDRERTRH